MSRQTPTCLRGLPVVRSALPCTPEQSIHVGKEEPKPTAKAFQPYTNEALRWLTRRQQLAARSNHLSHPLTMSKHDSFLLCVPIARNVKGGSAVPLAVARLMPLEDVIAAYLVFFFRERRRRPGEEEEEDRMSRNKVGWCTGLGMQNNGG